MAQHTTEQALPQRALDPLLDQFAPNVDQRPILNARRTGRFTVSAGQAAIQMRLGRLCRLDTLEHLLDQIDTATRTIAFVTQYLIGRTGCQAESAMHATTQYFIGFIALVGITRPSC